MTDDLRSELQWHPRYHPEWDADPWQYVHQGLLPHGRTRRLGSLAGTPAAVKLHVGVLHFDPARWGGRGEPYCRFFVSARSGRGSSGLWTHPTMEEVLLRVRALLATLAPAL